MNTLLVSNIGSLVTNDPQRGGLLGIVEGGAVAIVDGVVDWVGPEADTPSEYTDLPRLDAGKAAVLPGFVDPHTHLVFAGERSDEFARRLRGESYEEILAAGGGILSTVEATRAMLEDDLYEAAAERAWRMLATGTTTVEVKSGYGLDIATEAKMLRVARRLDESLPIDVIPTFLGAHVVPAEYRDDREAYVDLVCGEMLDVCAPLARFCDVFSDEAAFTVDEARRILEAAERSGLEVRIHADQLGRVGAAALAADLSAASADHLDHATDEDLAAMSDAGTSAVLLPAVSFSMRLPYPDGRRVWDSGVSVALATDCNPGTAYVESMAFVVALASLNMGLTPDEAVWAATMGSARSLNLDDRGHLARGAVADLVILDAPTHLHIPYRPDTDLVAAVIKNGVIL
ncbi:MAG: imidazolonepropionase [Actinomycetota bacterium]|nr:imidazolonepropionase [Actinomycetota bacterium]